MPRGSRPLPIGNAWNKLPRLVRDLARDLGKKIEEAIAPQMPPDGLLYLAAAETVLGVTDNFVPLAGEYGVYGLRPSRARYQTSQPSDTNRSVTASAEASPRVNA